MQNDDGAQPKSGLFLASDGGLYGTTWAGGLYNFGTVYKITLQPTFSEQVVYDFGQDNNTIVNPPVNLDGEYPAGPVIANPFGPGLLGVTSAGGQYGSGTVYTLNGPNLLTLHAFGGSEGAFPQGAPLVGTDHAIYGLANSGGQQDAGSIYRVDGQGNASAIYSFSGPDGRAPVGSMVLGSNGNFYGVTNMGGAFNSGAIFQLDLNTVPVITSLSPVSTSVLLGSFNLTVNGTGFTPTSIVSWGGSQVQTTFISQKQLVASITSSLDPSAGNYAVAVYNPPPGGATSNTVIYQITNPVPTLTSIMPTTIKAGHGMFVLTAFGSHYEFNSAIQWNGTTLTTEYLGNGTLTAVIPASYVSKPGTVKITVVTAAPGGGVSLAKLLTIAP